MVDSRRAIAKSIIATHLDATIHDEHNRTRQKIEETERRIEGCKLILTTYAGDESENAKLGIYERVVNFVKFVEPVVGPVVTDTHSDQSAAGESCKVTVTGSNLRFADGADPAEKVFFRDGDEGEEERETYEGYLEPPEGQTAVRGH